MTFARGDEQLARLLVGDQVELAVAVARLDVLQAVVLVGRRAQRLGQHASQSSTRSDSSPRRERKTVPSTPTRSPRSSVEQALACAPRRARRRAPAAGSGRSGRRGRGTPPCPGRGGRPGGRRRGSASSVSSPRLEVVVRGAHRRRSASTPGKPCGNGSMPVARAGARAWRGGRRAARSAGASGSPSRTAGALGRAHAARLQSPTSILVIFSLRAGPRGTCDRDDLAALVPEQRLADRRLVGELALGRVGLGRADDRVLRPTCRSSRP